MPFVGGEGAGGGGGVSQVCVAADTGSGSCITTSGTVTINGTAGEISTAVSGTTVTVGFSGTFSPAYAVTSVSADYSAVLSDRYILVDSSGGPITVTLLSAASTAGRVIVVKDKGAAGTNNVTVQAASGNIDGGASKAIKSNYGSYRVTSDGSDYFIV